MDARQMELFPLGQTDVLELPGRPALQAEDRIQDALPHFMAFMQQRAFAANTVKSFLNDMKLFIDFVGEETPLAKCSLERLEAFVHYLQYERDVPCSPKSLARRITTLKVFFGWLARYGILVPDPAANLVYGPARSPLPRVLTERQIEALLAVTRSMRDAEEAPDARPHLLITLLLSTGIKKAECMRLRLDQIDLSDPSQPTVYIHYDTPRQRAKSRRLALPAEWTETLGIYLRRYQPKERLFECTPRNLEYVLHTLSTVTRLPQPLTFETLRWTSAVRHYCAHMDEDHLRRRLGLSKMAWRYALPIIQRLAKKREKEITAG